MRVLQSLAKSGLLRNCLEQLVDRNAVQLSGLLRVEHKVVSVRLANSQPRLQCCLLIEERVALYLQQVLGRGEGTFEPGDVDLLIIEVDIRKAKVRNLLRSCAMSHSEEKHGVFPWAVFLCSLQETFKLLAAHVRDSSPNLLCSLFRHPNYVLYD